MLQPLCMACHLPYRSPSSATKRQWPLTTAFNTQIAAVFEFSGAVGLGGEVTKTIAGGIARPGAFLNNPEWVPGITAPPQLLTRTQQLSN